MCLNFLQLLKNLWMLITNMKEEFKVIANLIEDNTRVLDVGCGDGTLME